MLIINLEFNSFSIMKKLYRSREHHVISGVCAGLAEYFDIDPAIVRLAFIFIGLITGIIPALIVYIIAALALPLKPHA